MSHRSVNNYGSNADFQNFFVILSEICQKKDVKITLSRCFKGSLIAGSSAMVGGLLLGPIGLAIGGMIGGGAAALSSNFKSMPQVLLEMPEHEKRELYVSVMEELRKIDITQIAIILSLMVQQGSVQDIVLRETARYMREHMNMNLIL